MKFIENGSGDENRAAPLKLSILWFMIKSVPVPLSAILVESLVVHEEGGIELRRGIIDEKHWL